MSFVIGTGYCSLINYTCVIIDILIWSLLNKTWVLISVCVLTSSLRSNILYRVFNTRFYNLKIFKLSASLYIVYCSLVRLLLEYMAVHCYLFTATHQLTPSGFRDVFSSSPDYRYFKNVIFSA